MRTLAPIPPQLQVGNTAYIVNPRDQEVSVFSKVFIFYLKDASSETKCSVVIRNKYVQVATASMYTLQWVSRGSN